jgi:hypothetical protein
MAARANKRRYVRTRAQNLVAHLRVGDRTIQAPVDDISMGGMLARTGESIAIGTALMFDLARPGLKKPLRLLGVVVDTRIGRGLGIRFDGLDKEAADRLGDLIADLGGMTSPSNLLVDREPPPSAPPAPTGPLTSNLTSSGTGSFARPDLRNEPPPLIAPFPSPTPTQTLPSPVPAPSPSSTSYRTANAASPAGSSGMQSPPHSATAVPTTGHGPSDNEAKLTAQMRSMVMELGRLQELVQQREKELHDARSEIARLKSEAGHGEAAQRIVGRLEIEKTKLESQLAEARQRTRLDVEVAQREAEQATAAIGRLVDALNRLR